MKIKKLVYIGIFAAVTAILSQIALPLGAIPFSLGTFAVFLCGAILPPPSAFASQCVYLLLGFIGLPVYANFMSGAGILFGMTGGYLMSYPFMALLTAFTVKKAGRHSVIFSALGMLSGQFLCYIFGTFWVVLITGSPFISALSTCVFPFLPLDLVKIALAAFSGATLRKTLAKAGVITL